MCISPCALSGASQEKALSMRLGLPVGVDAEVRRPLRVAEVRAVQGLAGAGVRVGAGMGRRGLGVGRLEAEAAGPLDGAQQDLQQVQRPAGLEAVGVGRDAAHGVHGDGAGGGGCVPLAPEVGPGARHLEGLVEGGLGEARGEGVDARGFDPAALGHRLGGVASVHVALDQGPEDGGAALVRAVEVRLDAGRVERREGPGAAVDDLRLAVRARVRRSPSASSSSGASVQRAR